jgi:hypothetical protein
MALRVFSSTPWEGKQGKKKTGKCFRDQPEDTEQQREHEVGINSIHAVALNWPGIVYVGTGDTAGWPCVNGARQRQT